MTDTPPNLAVAPWRHTLTLCAILLGIAAMGFAASRAATGPAAPGGAVGGLALYPMLILAEFGLFWLVRRGLKKGGVRVLDLISARPLSARSLAFDIVLGLGLLGTIVALETLLRGPSGGAPPLVQRLLVRSSAEIPLWVLVSLAAGFVEELTFRGYLQRQFASKLGIVFGIAAQAMLFGIVHGYQGLAPLLGITILGLIFGIFAWARKSLVPGMVAHAAIDILGGLQLLQ